MYVLGVLCLSCVCVLPQTVLAYQIIRSFIMYYMGGFPFHLTGHAADVAADHLCRPRLEQALGAAVPAIQSDRASALALHGPARTR